MKKKIKLNKNKGILFWITGRSGSGKTIIGSKIYKSITKLYGPTVLASGDDLRRIFNFKGYTAKERNKLDIPFTKFYAFITNQKVNLIFTAVGLSKYTRDLNRKKIENYVEIFIKADINKIIKLKRKKIYHNNKKNIVGLHIKPEFPTRPNIVIENNFKKSTTQLANELLIKIKKTL